MSDLFWSSDFKRLWGNKCEIFRYEGAHGRGEILFILTPLKVDPSYHDLETPHGYGGHRLVCDDDKFIDEYRNAWETFCEKRKIVCEFHRCYPEINQIFYRKSGYDLSMNKKNVIIDLSIAPKKDLLTSYDCKLRNIIRKGYSRSQIAVEREPSDLDLDVFRKGYINFLKRINSEKKYYYDENMWSNLVDNQSVYLVTVRENQKVLNQSLFLANGSYAQYFLSYRANETKENFSNAAAIHGMIELLQKMPTTYLILGGGVTQSDEDPLLRFKSKFSPAYFDFMIATRIVNQEIYSKLQLSNPNQILSYR